MTCDTGTVYAPADSDCAIPAAVVPCHKWCDRYRAPAARYIIDAANTPVLAGLLALALHHLVARPVYRLSASLINVFLTRLCMHVHRIFQRNRDGTRNPLEIFRVSKPWIRM